MAQRLILGIDPGLHITGYALVAADARPALLEAGVLRMGSHTALADCLVELQRQLSALLKEWTISHLGLEQLYAHYRHPRTAILMGHARGVILCAATAAAIPTYDLPSTLVKKTITGNGHAPKKQMQMAVASICHLPGPPEPPDVADAIAIAWTLALRLSHGNGLAAPVPGAHRRRATLPASVARRYNLKRRVFKP